MIGIRSVKEIGQSNTCRSSSKRRASFELRASSSLQKVAQKWSLRTFKDNERIGGGVSRNFAEAREKSEHSGSKQRESERTKV